VKPRLSPACPCGAPWPPRPYTPLVSSKPADASADDAYLDAYRAAHQRHGAEFDVTLWASEKTQRRRFEVFTEMLDLHGRRLLDAGCSRGDLAAYLLASKVKYARYVGVDALPEVIEYARERGLKRADFEVCDFVQNPHCLASMSPDVVMISGTLNTMPIDTALAVLDGAWEAAGEALIFNFLPDTASPQAPRQAYPAHRLSTFQLLGWAVRQTWAVQYRQDYFPEGHDATVLMRKPR